MYFLELIMHVLHVLQHPPHPSSKTHLCLRPVPARVTHERSRNTNTRDHGGSTLRRAATQDQNVGTSASVCM